LTVGCERICRSSIYANPKASDKVTNVNWNSRTIKERCQIIARVANEITLAAEELIELCRSDHRTDACETIAAELIPLCDGLRWLERHGARCLAPKQYGWRGRPVWLWGVHSEVRRDPLGTVLILAAWNYPILLPGVQLAQSLVAGNRVCLKPAQGCEAVTRRLVECFYSSGVPESSLELLPSSPQAAIDAMNRGVNLVVLTGSSQTGRSVMRHAAETLTPCILELGGCDAVIALDDCDLDRIASSVRFALTFNSGATCIGPRRIFASHQVADQIVHDLVGPWRAEVPKYVIHPRARELVARTIAEAVSEGAVDVLGRFDAEAVRRTGQMSPVILDQVQQGQRITSADLFAPVVSVIRVGSADDAVARVNECPFGLTTSVFGSEASCRHVARRLQVGTVVINDIMVPTVDPRLSFGGRGESGFGVTRGEEGLLALTRPVVVAVRRGRLLLHLKERQPGDAQRLLGILQWTHAIDFSRRMAGLRRILWPR
jgi:aldehyde dehydrogenase (NAD+)